MRRLAVMESEPCVVVAHDCSIRLPIRACPDCSTSRYACWRRRDGCRNEWLSDGRHVHQKVYLQVGDARIAYCDAGNGAPLLLLHGCPFSSFIWRKVIPRLSTRFHCLAPDLLGLGDTETPADADWSQRAQAAMVVGFLDGLGIERVRVVGHDHGAAVAQLMAAECPERVDRLVLSNAEAYDNWPSARERPFVRVTQIPVLGDAVMWLYARRPIFRLALI